MNRKAVKALSILDQVIIPAHNALREEKYLLADVYAQGAVKALRKIVDALEAGQVERTPEFKKELTLRISDIEAITAQAFEGLKAELRR